MIRFILFIIAVAFCAWGNKVADRAKDIKGALVAVPIVLAGLLIYFVGAVYLDQRDDERCAAVGGQTVGSTCMVGDFTVVKP